MKIIEIIIGIFIKIIMILWGIVSLLVLTFVSIFIYIVFLIKIWFLKRKFSNKTNSVNSEKILHTSPPPYHNVKTGETKESPAKIQEIHTIKRNLKTKDGEYN